MKKRILSLALCLCLVLTLLPTATLAAGNGSGDADTAAATADAADQSTYDALGLTTNASADDTVSPYGESTSQLMTGSEVYLTANGEYGNCYTLRNGMDRMGGALEEKYNGNDRKDFEYNNADDAQKGCGALYGGYEFYNISRGFTDKAVSAPDSMLSSNGLDFLSLLAGKSSKVLSNESNGWCGLYATSTEFNATSGNDAKDNFVAELQVNGDTNNDSKYVINLVTYSIDAGGNRTQVESVTVTDNASWITSRYSSQEFDALFEVAAGDIDGDNMDEIAVYCGNTQDSGQTRYAQVFIYEGDTLALKQTLALNAGGKSGYKSGNNGFYSRPTVTLAMGDLNRDLYEDLAAVVTMPAGCNAYDESAAYFFQSGMQGSAQGSQTRQLPSTATAVIPLKSSDYSMVSGNCAFGTTTLPDSSSAGTVLMIGGYAAGNVDSVNFSKGLYTTLYYDYDTGKYVASAVNTLNLSDRTLLLTKYQVGDSGRSGMFYAPLPLAFADLDGVSGATQNDDLLFGATAYTFSMDGGFGDERGDLSLSMAQRDLNGESEDDKQQIWVGDVTVGCVTNENSESCGGPGTDDQTSAAWSDSILYVVGSYTAAGGSIRKDENGKKSDYYCMDLGGFWLYKNGSNYTAQSAQEGVISDGNATNNRYGSYISLCLPDVDNDSVVMRFKDKYVTYTVPEVYAVLQASPYFSDLQDAYGYIGNGGTSYSAGHSSGSTEGTSLGLQVGVYTSGSASFFAEGEFEMEADMGASYEFSAGQETGYDITYNNQSGDDDAVVMYTVPIIYYAYDVYEPASGSWSSTLFPTTLEPVTSVLGVTEYDNIAEKTDGLDPIRGNLINSTPGEPSTYVNTPAGDREYSYKGDGDSKTNYSLASAGTAADITQEISHSATKENSFELYTEISEKVGGGCDFFVAEGTSGVTSNQHIGVTAGWSSSKDTDYSGTVDNLPKDAAGYSFSWRLIVNSAELNGNKVWVVGYDVQNVNEPPRMPQNLRVESVTADSVTLNWEASNNAEYYNVYMVDSAENYNYLYAVPATFGATLSSTVSELEANRTYRFAVQAVSSVNGNSIFSPTVSAQTMTKGGFSIVTSPQDQTVNVNSPAAFTAKGAYTGGSQTVRYQWQSCTDGSTWTDVSGATGAVYTIKSAEKSADGTQYRCRAYCLDSSLYTSPATLTVNLLGSSVTLGGVKANEIYAASGYTSEEKTSTASSKSAIIVTNTARTAAYTLMNKDSFWLWLGTDGKYYVYNGTSPTLKNGVVSGAENIKFENVGNKAASTTAYFANTDDIYNMTALGNPTDDGTTKLTVNNVQYTVVRTWSVDSVVYKELQSTVDGVSSTIYVYGDNNTRFDLVTHTVVSGIDTSTMTAAKKTVAANATYVEYTPIAGDTLTLTAAPKSGDTGITGPVTFVVTGAAGTTLTAAKNADGSYTAVWTPPAAGKYTVTAVYAGTSTYAASASDPISFYAALAGNSVLSLTMPANTTYGESVSLAATKTSGKMGSAGASSSDVTKDNGTAYTVEKLVKVENGGITTYEYQAAGVKDYDLDKTAGTFTPLLATNFLITATNGALTASAVTTVGKATLTIAANDRSSTAETPAAERPALSTAITPSVDLVAGEDYTLTSNGATATAPGTYPITAALKDTDNSDDSVTRTEKVTNLLTNYYIVLKSGVYTLGTQTYTLTLDVEENGTASVDYVYGGQTIHAAGTDDKYTIPSGAEVTVTAEPDTGYAVDKWAVDGDAQSNTTDTCSIGKITENSTVSVSFALIHSKLSFSAASADGGQSSGGSVSGAYITSTGTGAQFTSGSNVFYDSRVRVTATPNDGMTVDHWTVKTGSGDAVTIKTGDGVTNYSGTTYDFGGLSEDTAVTVYFAAKEPVPVTVKLLDKNGTPLSGSGVIVTSDRKGTQTLAAENGEYSYAGSTGENISLSVTIPDNMLVQNWSVGDGQITGSLSNGKKTMTVYNLSAATDFTVVCAAPNEYTVTFDGAMTDNAAYNADTVGIVTAKQINGGALTTGTTLIEGSAITFTAAPKIGYVLTGWKVNGELTDKTDLSWTLNTLSEDTDVTAVFKKLSNIEVKFSVYDKNGDTTEGGFNGNVKAEAVRGTDVTYTQTSGTTENAYVTSGSFAAVYEGSSVTFTAQPDVGYKVALWTVNGEKQESTANTLVLSIADSSDGMEVVVKYELIGDRITFDCGSHGSISAKTPTGENFISGNTVTAAMDISFTAAPDAGYAVSGWTLNGNRVENQAGGAVTDTEYTYAADGSTGASIHVDFQRCAYSVTYAGDTHGTVSATQNGVSIGASPVEAVTGDTKVTFTAVPETGYHFTGWTVTEGGEPVSIDESLTGQFARDITANLSVTATFALTEQNYTVNYSVSPAGSGTITAKRGGTAFETGAELPQQSAVTFTAVPADGWQVKEWQVNNAAVANTLEQNSYTIDSLLKNVTVVAVLEKIPTYTITVTKDFGAGSTGSGTVAATVNGETAALDAQGKLTVPQHAAVVLTATPAAGNLASWTVTPDSGTIGGTASALTLSFSDVTSDIACTAAFTAAQQIEVTATVLDGGGIISSVTAVDANQKITNIDGAYDQGVSATSGQTLVFMAQPEKDKMIAGWYVSYPNVKALLKNTSIPEGDKQSELGNTLTLENVSTDVKVTAVFATLSQHSFDVADSHTKTSFTKTPEWKGTNTTIREGGTVIFTVKPESGYLIDDVTVSANTVSKQENADHTWTVTVSNVQSDFSVTPKAVKGYTVSFSAGNGGTVSAAADGKMISSGAMVKSGSTVVFTAVPNSNYTISAWTGDGTVSSDKTTSTIDKLAENTNAMVSFTYNGGGGGGVSTSSNYTLTFESNGGGALESISKAADTVIDLATYLPTREGYVFSGWCSDYALRTVIKSVTLNKDTTVYAKWSPASVDTLLNTKDHTAYLAGYTDGTFGPEKDITRAETAMIFYRLLNDQTAGGTGSFSDVDADKWYTAAVEKLAGLGIITGYSDGTFHPEAAITRAEFTAIASRFATMQKGDVNFSDVDTAHWAYTYIASASAQGWISGFADGTFHPDDNITRAQVAKIVNRMLGRSADEDFISGHTVKTFSDVAKAHWAYYDIIEAANAHEYTKLNDKEIWSALN